MFVTVTIPNGEHRHPHALVSGIHETMEQAAKLCAKHTDHRIDAFAWDHTVPPRLGEMVRVDGKELHQLRKFGLGELLDAALKRGDLARLRATNEVLAQRNAVLASRLVTKKTFSHAVLHKETTPSCQARFLWVAATPHLARENIVADFAGCQQPWMYERVMLAPDRQTVDHLNRLAQENRLEQPDFDRSRGIAHERVLLHAGDRIQILRDDAERGLHAGDLGEIAQLNTTTRTLALFLDRSEVKDSLVVFVPLREFPHVDLGYAATYEQAPRLQLEHAMVLADVASPAAALVESLTAKHVDIHCDRVAAAIHFPRLLAREQADPAQQIEPDVDPLRDHPLVQER